MVRVLVHVSTTRVLRMCGYYEQYLRMNDTKPGEKEQLRKSMQITKTELDEIDWNCSFGVAGEAELPFV